MKWSVVFLAAVNANPSQGFPQNQTGDHVGNGGKVVVCRDPQDRINTIELLDFYEGKVLYQLEPRFVGEDLTSRVAAAIRHMEDLAPWRMRWYLKLLDEFFANTKFIDAPLTDTGDSDHILSPPRGCEMEQAAIQIAPQFPGDKRYNISSEHWQALDDAGRAGLVLHEIIYYEGILRGHPNSLAVRYLNVYLASGSLGDLSQEAFREMMSKTSFRTAGWDSENRHWVFLASIRVGWHVARRACREIARATLPSRFDIRQDGEALARSPLAEFVGRNAFAESWTGDRRSEDGKVAVALWQPTSLQIRWRRYDDSANIVCQRRKE